jgi:K+-sensing histidine kinase KdpD
MLRTNEKANRFLKLLLVLASVALTALTKYYGTELLGESPPLIIFLPAVIIVGFIGGFATGAAATILSGFVAEYFLLYPTLTFAIESTHDHVQLGVFCVIGLVISYLFETVHSQEFKLAKANKTKSRFIATLAHELRVPLNRVSLLSSEMLADQKLPDEYRKKVTEINLSNEVEYKKGNLSLSQF